jgi:hypothetical protein
VLPLPLGFLNTNREAQAMEITKCRLLMTRSGQTAHYDADLIFVEGLPYAVVEWIGQTPQAEDTPSVKVALEPKWLHPMSGWGAVTHMYEMPIQDPRPMH